MPIAIIGVGYIALTSKEYLYGLLGNNGILKAKATTIETTIAAIYAKTMSNGPMLTLANPNTFP